MTNVPNTPAWLDRKEYPFRSRWLRTPAGNIHYLDEGHGPVLLFAHGTPTWSFEWRHLVRSLSGSFRCIAPDHLGFGLSDRPRDADYRPEAHAKRFAAFVDELGLDRVSLVVHDFGGPIALPLAIAEPRRIDGLVVINSWLWSFTDDPTDDPAFVRQARVAGGPIGRWMYRWLNAPLRLLMPSVYGDRRKLTRAIHRQYLRPFRDRWSRENVLWTLARALLGSSGFYEASWGQRERLRGIPTALVWGMRDRAFGPAHLARWRQALPHAAVHELASAGHWPHEEAPEAVAAAIRNTVVANAHAETRVVPSSA